MKTTPIRRTASLIALCSLLFLGGCGAPEGNIENGKRWYSMNNCFSCHGYNASDGRAANIARTELGFSGFLRYLRKPSSASMPKFPEEKISKQDAADIYAWLQSLPE